MMTWWQGERSRSRLAASQEPMAAAHRSRRQSQRCLASQKPTPGSRRARCSAARRSRIATLWLTTALPSLRPGTGRPTRSRVPPAGRLTLACEAQHAAAPAVLGARDKCALAILLVLSLQRLDARAEHSPYCMCETPLQCARGRRKERAPAWAGTPCRAGATAAPQRRRPAAGRTSRRRATARRPGGRRRSTPWTRRPRARQPPGPSPPAARCTPS